LISLSFAIVYSYIMEIIDRQNEMAAMPNAKVTIDEDEGYDL
jgi:PTS system mannose-specific IIC component